MASGVRSPGWRADHHDLGRMPAGVGSIRIGSANHARRDGVDPNTRRSELRRPRSRQGLDGALGGAVERARDAEAGDPRAQVDDRATAGVGHGRSDSPVRKYGALTLTA